MSVNITTKLGCTTNTVPISIEKLKAAGVENPVNMEINSPTMALWLLQSHFLGDEKSRDPRWNGYVDRIITAAKEIGMKHAMDGSSFEDWKKYYLSLPVVSKYLEQYITITLHPLDKVGKTVDDIHHLLNGTGCTKEDFEMVLNKLNERNQIIKDDRKVPYKYRLLTRENIHFLRRRIEILLDPLNKHSRNTGGLRAKDLIELFWTYYKFPVDLITMEFILREMCRDSILKEVGGKYTKC
jgi:hypothetical protein